MLGLQAASIRECVWGLAASNLNETNEFMDSYSTDRL